MEVVPRSRIVCWNFQYWFNYHFISNLWKF